MSVDSAHNNHIRIYTQSHYERRLVNLNNLKLKPYNIGFNDNLIYK